MQSKNKTASLPDPLPPRSDGTKVQSLSPVEAKRRYIESQATKEFLMNPKESIVKLQHEMNQTKLKLHKEIDKPLWTRIVNRVKTRQHSVINLLMASLAYLLAHRLDLKMKEIKSLNDDIASERVKNSKLRAVLRSITTEEFVRGVVVSASASASASATENDQQTAATDQQKPSTWFLGWSTKTKSSSSMPVSNPSSLLSEKDSSRLFIDSLRQKLEEKIGVEGVDDGDDRKRKRIQILWKENESKMKDDVDEGLSDDIINIEEMTKKIEQQQQQNDTKNGRDNENNMIAINTTYDDRRDDTKTTDKIVSLSSKTKRVFDM